MRLGVLLLNLGGPSSLRDVQPFLYRLFSDSDIIPVPFERVFQKPVAYFISVLRNKKSWGYYSAIGGRSPLLEITRLQASTLEERLQHRFKDAKVYIAMRYSQPDTESVWPEITRDKISNLIVLPLYPQYSMATTGSSYKELKKVMKSESLKESFITHWHTHPVDIDRWAQLIQSTIAKLPIQHQKDFILLFSAHSLPMKLIQRGDPYEKQIHETMDLILSKFDPRPYAYLSYQSKAGPIRWLEPSTLDLLKNLSKYQKKALIVVPISFVSDHVETLYEIDILYKTVAEKLGFPYFIRVPAFNASPSLIDVLEDLVVRHL